MSSYLYLNNQHAESITMADLFTEWTLVAVWSYWQTQSHEIPPASHQITRIVMHGLMTWRTSLLGRFDALICSYLLCTMSVLRATLISPKTQGSLKNGIYLMLSLLVHSQIQEFLSVKNCHSFCSSFARSIFAVSIYVILNMDTSHILPVKCWINLVWRMSSWVLDIWPWYLINYPDLPLRIKCIGFNVEEVGKCSFD